MTILAEFLNRLRSYSAYILSRASKWGPGGLSGLSPGYSVCLLTLSGGCGLPAPTLWPYIIGQ